MKIVFNYLFGCTLFSISNGVESNLRKRSRLLNEGYVTDLVLVNADTGDERINLIPNTVNIINLQGLGLPLSTRFNVDAILNDPNEIVDEVVFDNGKDEGKAPYARCGNKGDDFRPCDDLQYGAYIEVNATSYDENGYTINTLSAIVQIIDGTASPTSSSAPTMAPATAAPTLAPATSAPVTAAPTKAPVTAAPVSTPSGCGIPEFVGKWEDFKDYPLKIAEAQGAMIGNDLLIVGGFEDGFDRVTERNYALDIRNPNGSWRRQDDIPVNDGITHAAFVVIGRKFYMCGGYIGGAPGPQTDVCLIYDHDAESGKQWITDALPPLPEPRGGGAMVYSKKHNTLTYSAGAQRPERGSAYTVDYRDTWSLDLGDIGRGWVAKDDIPFEANHVGFVTAYDDKGNERHYFLGGHVKQDKDNGYVDDNYEWDADNEKWIKRKDMIITGGHISSSTRPIGGFLIAGGSSNGVGKIDDVFYYDIPTDSWTKMDTLDISVNTPVCDFGVDGYFYCTTGPPGRTVSFRRKVEIRYD